MEVLNFLAIGDFGWDTMIRNKVIRIMDKNKNRLTGVLALGDNFYDVGVSSIHDQRWEEWETSFRPSCPWYAVLGNHDYLSNPDAQVSYTLHSRYWNMPKRYYDKKFFFKDQTKGVHFFFLDTFTLCPRVSRGLSLAMGMASFDDKYGTRDNEQLRWLDSKLSESTLPWRVVVGHYPVFSNGHHGSTREMLEHVLPILRHHKVDFYLSGHDHDMECIEVDDTHYLVSGAGCSSNSIKKGQTPSLFRSEGGTAGIAFLQFRQETASFGFIGEDDKLLFHRNALPRHSQVRYFL